MSKQNNNNIKGIYPFPIDLSNCRNINSYALTTGYTHGLYTEIDHAFAYQNINDQAIYKPAINLTLANLAVITWIPSIGLSNFDTKGVNASQQHIYTWIRNHNTSLSAYSQNDILMRFIALDNLNILKGLIETCFDVFGTNAIPTTDLYQDKLRKAYNLTSADQDVIANLKNKFNDIIRQTNSLKIPADIPIFKRHYAMTRKVFYDDYNLEESQIICFIPDYLYELDCDASSSTVGKLILNSIYNSGNMNLVSLIDLFERLVKTYTLDQDMTNIIAELKKALGPGDRYFVWSEYLEQGSITPVFSLEMQDQIKNMEMVKVKTPTTSLIIEEDVSKDSIIYPSRVEITGPAFIDEHFVYTKNENLTGEETIQNMSWKFFAEVDSNKKFWIRSCGTELITAVRLFYRTSSGTIMSYNVDSNFQLSYSSGTLGINADIIKYWCKFASLPMLIYYSNTSTGVTAGSNFVFTGDVDNYALVNKYEADNIYKLVSMSQFVPNGIEYNS